MKQILLVLAGMLCGSTLEPRPSAAARTAPTERSISRDERGRFFDPASFNPPLDPDHDNVYQFTTIKIPSSLTVRLSAEILGVKPVVWLATGDVESMELSISVVRMGILRLRSTVPHQGGAGGYPGGREKHHITLAAWTRSGSGTRPRWGAGHVIAGLGLEPVSMACLTAMTS